MKKVLFLCFAVLMSAAAAFAQDKEISGTVYDSSGEGLAGVGVMVKGTTVGTMTDLDGSFTLKVPEDAVLEISCLGFQTQEISASGRNTFEITMTDDAELLEGTVVIGYGTVKRTNFTGSVATYSVSDGPVANVPKTSALDMLRGIAPGLAMSQSGIAGQSPSLQVRGQRSISGGSDPLIVLDGVIYKGEINDIDPNSIESMSVMKDATSLASYGSQAANGVIMITSKKGERGKPTVDFRASVGLVEQNYKPELRNGEQYIELINARRGEPEGSTSWMSPLELANYEAGRETDWVDYISQTGVQQEYGVSVSGGGEGMNYYVGTSYSDLTNFIKGNRFIRETVTARINANVNKYISLGFNFNWSSSQDDGVRPGYSRWFSPYGQPTLEDGSIRKYIIGPTQETATNPLWPIESGSVDSQLRGNAVTVGGNLNIEIPWVKGLSYRITGNYSTRNMLIRRFNHEKYYIQANDGDEYTTELFDRYLSQATGYITNRRNIDWVLDNILTYDREIGNHYVNATLVYTMDSSLREGTNVTGTDFSDIGNTTLGFYGLSNAKTQTIDEISYTLHNDIGYLARVNYSYANKYHLNASIRRDGSSVFGSDRKWGNFPAVGVAWTISDENFMKGAKWLDYLKLKASWGKNGNQSLAPYGTLSRMDMGKTGGIVGYFGDEHVFGQAMTTLGNPDLGWETTTSWNFGFETDFLHRRMHLEVDAYTSKTTDQIFNRTIPVMGAGITNQSATMGRVDNWGIEASLRGQIIKTDDIDWSATLNFTMNRNKLVELYGDGKDDIVNNLFIGHSLGAIYGYVWDGVVQEWDTEYMERNGVTPGDIKNKDIDGDGYITENDRTILGYDKEAFRMSLATTFRWKNLTVYALFNGIFSGGMYGKALNNNAYLSSTENMQYLNTLNHPFWTPENKSNVYPKPWNVGGELYALQNYGFVRLQDLNISYSLPQRWLKVVGIKNLQVFVSGQNLFFIAPGWEYSDPEVRSFQSQQLRRTYTFGLNLRF